MRKAWTEDFRVLVDVQKGSLDIFSKHLKVALNRAQSRTYVLNIKLVKKIARTKPAGALNLFFTNIEAGEP